MLAGVLALHGLGCSQELDAGSNLPRGQLPVDARNPVVLLNDGASDNWQGEYAVLLANGGGPKLVGIVVNANYPWNDLEENLSGWKSLITAARESGLAGLPDPLASPGAALTRPDTGNIEDTAPNRSAGALFIVDAAARFGLPYRPLVIVSGGRLSDIADAYLIDPSVAERIVVVSALGRLTATGGAMEIPNGFLDTWADSIVTTRLRYVQVSAYYDQLSDVPDSRVAELPQNALGEWIGAKRSNLHESAEASDQVGILAVGVPEFVSAVSRVSASGLTPAGSSAGPELLTDPMGPAWLVTATDGSRARQRLWELLLDPSTFGR